MTIYSPERELSSVLDTIMVADIVCFVVAAGETVDGVGEQCRAVAQEQGLPTVLSIVQNLESLPEAARAVEKKKWQSWTLGCFGNTTRCATLGSTESEALGLLRTLTTIKITRPQARDDRPYMLVCKSEIAEENGETGTCTLKLQGYVRGRPLSVNQLVHLPGTGTFQLKQIDGPADMCPLMGGSRGGTSRRCTSAGMSGRDDMQMMTDNLPRNPNAMDESSSGAGGGAGAAAAAPYCVILRTAEPGRGEPLEMAREPDPMEGEQTWPTEEELAAAAASKPKKMKPKGWSSYQAAWLIDEEGEGDGTSGSESEGGADGDDMQEAGDAPGDGHEDAPDVEDEDEEEEEEEEEDDDDDEGEEGRRKFEEERDSFLAAKKAAAEDNQFPDEVDTPLDVPARKRFARYRGLKSFRTSPWDPKESLPLDYARIFQLENPGRSRALARRAVCDGDGVAVGTFVTLHLANVPLAVAASASPQRKVVVLTALLRHENRMTTMHCLLHLHPGRGHVIKAKESLVFVVGHRRFEGCPIFSEHGSRGDRFKMLRFFKEGAPVVATLYAPLTFDPCKVTVMKRMPSGAMSLVAAGHLLPADPDRIVLKRVVLSGYPIKIKKRKAVARFMFFNPEDVKYFKPLELWTKHGRRGHIREALGTHGHMKCIFDAPVTQQDTVCLSLYKRVFPKWPAVLP